MNASTNAGGGSHAGADPEWHERFAQALTSRDLETYLDFLHEDCTLQVNNALPLYGKRAIAASYAAYLPTFRTLNAEIVNVIGTESQSAIEFLLHYVCIDNSKEVVACATLLDRNADGLATAPRVYGNAARVFKPFMEEKR
jgi:hypothetical protein